MQYNVGGQRGNELVVQEQVVEKVVDCVCRYVVAVPGRGDSSSSMARYSR